MFKGMAGRKVTLVCCLSLLLSFSLLSACSEDNSTPSDTSGEKPSISILAPLHFPQTPSKDLIAEIEKLTGTQLNITWVPEGVYTDKMNTALTTSSLGKVTFVKFTDYNPVKNMIRSGAFWEIGPYLEEFPNLGQLDASILKQTTVDGGFMASTRKDLLPGRASLSARTGWRICTSVRPARWMSCTR